MQGYKLQRVTQLINTSKGSCHYTTYFVTNERFVINTKSYNYAQEKLQFQQKKSRRNPGLPLVSWQEQICKTKSAEKESMSVVM